MAKTTFSGPMKIGTSKDNSALTPNLGFVKLQQDVTITIPANITTVIDADGQSLSQYLSSPAVPFAAATVAASAIMYLPASAQVLDIVIDVTTAIVGPTAANLTIGFTAGGADFVSTVNLMTGPVVRVRPTFTNAQLLAMANVTTNTAIYVTLTGTVANFTAGAVLVSMEYAQN